MPNERPSANFSIDGYEVSATFADAGNLTAISRAKQILLSAFVASASSFKGILAISPEQRDNSSGGKLHTNFNIDFEQFSFGMDIVTIAA